MRLVLLLKFKIWGKITRWLVGGFVMSRVPSTAHILMNGLQIHPLLWGCGGVLENFRNVEELVIRRFVIGRFTVARKCCQLVVKAPVHLWVNYYCTARSTENLHFHFKNC